MTNYIDMPNIALMLLSAACLDYVKHEDAKERDAMGSLSFMAIGFDGPRYPANRANEMFEYILNSREGIAVNPPDLEAQLTKAWDETRPIKKAARNG